jgi:hypothetical protein
MPFWGHCIADRGRNCRNAIKESSKEVDHVEMEKQVLTRQLVDLQDKYDKAISSLEHCRLEMSHERYNLSVFTKPSTFLVRCIFSSGLVSTSLQAQRS